MIKYILRNIQFSSKEFSKSIVKSLFSSFGIILLISFIVVYLSIRQSVKDYIGNRLFGTLAINEIVIYPKTKKGKEVYSPLASKANTIKPWQVSKIKKMKELKKVYSLTRLDYTTWIRMGMMGKYRDTHVPVCGIDRGFFKGKHRRWKQFYNNPNEIPVIAPKFTVQLLNNYTAIYNMPQFTEKQLLDYPIQLKIITTKHKFFGGSDEKKEYILPAKALFFSSVINFPAIFVPNSFLRSFAKKHRKDRKKSIKGYVYIRIYAKVKNVKKLPQITKKIRKMGLKVESRSDISRKTNKAMSMIDGIMFFVGAVMLILTIISIFNSYLVIVYNRSYSFSLKRVIGVSKIRIIMDFVIESALIGALYGVIGYFIGTYLTGYVSDNLPQWIPTLKGLILKPAGDGLLYKVIILSMIISALSAFIPAVFASNKNLFQAVRR